MDSAAELLRRSPVIASVKHEEDLGASLASPCRMVHLLYGDLTSIRESTMRTAEAGKSVFLNIDMVDGLAPRASAVEYVAREMPVHGILTSKAALCRVARAQGLVSVLRFFMVDSFAYDQVLFQCASAKADAVEILPGCIPRVIRWMRAETDIPIIAGGLVCTVKDIEMALEAGADAIATSSKELWPTAAVLGERERPGVGARS